MDDKTLPGLGPDAQVHPSKRETMKAPKEDPDDAGGADLAATRRAIRAIELPEDRESDPRTAPTARPAPLSASEDELVSATGPTIPPARAPNATAPSAAPRRVPTIPRAPIAAAAPAPANRTVAGPRGASPPSSARGASAHKVSGAVEETVRVARKDPRREED